MAMFVSCSTFVLPFALPSNIVYVHPGWNPGHRVDDSDEEDYDENYDDYDNHYEDDDPYDYDDYPPEEQDDQDYYDSEDLGEGDDYSDDEAPVQTGLQKMPNLVVFLTKWSHCAARVVGSINVTAKNAMLTPRNRIAATSATDAALVALVLSFKHSASLLSSSFQGPQA